MPVFLPAAGSGGKLLAVIGVVIAAGLTYYRLMISASGWFMMLMAVGGVTVWLLWAVAKVLRTPDEEKKLHHFEFETPDAVEEFEHKPMK